MDAPADPKLIEDLEAANRILADQGVFVEKTLSVSLVVDHTR